MVNQETLLRKGNLLRGPVCLNRRDSLRRRLSCNGNALSSSVQQEKLLPKEILLRYELAKLINMPHESTVFQNILKDSPYDYDWDMSDTLEKAYAEQKLPRYPLSKRLLDKTKVTDEWAEKMNAKKARTDKEKKDAGALPALDQETTVKTEVKEVEEGEDVLIPRCSSYNRQVAAQVKTFKNLILKLEVNERTDKTASTEKALKKGLSTLEQLEQELGRAVFRRHF